MERWRKPAGVDLAPLKAKAVGWGEWVCRECGCSFGAAKRKRRLRGLRKLFLASQVTCSPECQKLRQARTYDRWLKRRRAK
jgi:hypothetical protein